jgi:hypothetical protein
MLPAHRKLQENIAEYVIYMFQIEDIVRAFDLNIDRLMQEFVEPQLNDAALIEEYRKWYEELIKDMKVQRIEKSGHLHELKEILVELSYLHNVMMNRAGDKRYKQIYEQALPSLNDLRERSNLKEKNDLELAFHGLYMKLLMRLQRREISEATEKAFESMSAMLGYLAGAYKKMKNGDLDFLNN